MNPNTSINVVELKISNYSNSLVGLYYKSSVSSQIVDRDLFDPVNCAQIKQCVKSENNYIVFALEDAERVTLNIVPSNLN